MRTPYKPHRYYFGQLRRLILHAHKANPAARPSQLVAILAKQKVETTAKYVSKTIRADRIQMRWMNGRFEKTEDASVKFQRGPAPKGTNGSPTNKRDRRPAAFPERPKQKQRKPVHERQTKKAKPSNAVARRAKSAVPRKGRKMGTDRPRRTIGPRRKTQD